MLHIPAQQTYNILIYIQQDATLHSLFYLETALHVSGGTTTRHQEHKQLYLQHLVFVRPLLLSAAIVEKLELCCEWRTPGYVYVYEPLIVIRIISNLFFHSVKWSLLLAISNALCHEVTESLHVMHIAYSITIHFPSKSHSLNLLNTKYFLTVQHCYGTEQQNQNKNHCY